MAEMTSSLMAPFQSPQNIDSVIILSRVGEYIDWGFLLFGPYTGQM